MAPKIEFRDRSSGQRGSNSNVLEGPRLPCAREGCRKALERFFESKFWLTFSKSKLKHRERLELRIENRHFAWGLSGKHTDLHFISIPLDSIQFWGTSFFSELGESSMFGAACNRAVNRPVLALLIQLNHHLSYLSACHANYQWNQHFY